MRLAIALCIGLLGLLSTVVVAACAADEIIDCEQVCDRYSDCVTDIDVSECRRRCEDDSRNSDDFDVRIERCSNCTDDRTCAEAESCWDDCPIDPVPD